MIRVRASFALLAALLMTACGGGPTEPSDYEFGRADVYVRDTDGQPVNGVPVRLDRRDGGREDEGGLTGSFSQPGYYFFLKTTGQYRIVITVPAGYTLAPNQQASIDMQFQRDQVQTFTFVLWRQS